MTIKDPPAAELVVCPVKIKRPAVGAGGVLPEDKRRALGALAAAYDDVFDQLVRLIEWNKPGACTVSPPSGPAAGPSVTR